MMEILTIVALVAVPISAVLIGHHLQDRAKKHDEKMQIFKVLMTARIYGWTENGVHALNLIDVVFSDSKNVRDAWKEYRASLSVANVDSFNAKDAKTKHHKLLEAISDELGYKGKITWETIQNPYIPDGLYNMWEEQSKSREEYSQIQKGIGAVLNSGVLNGVAQFMPPPAEKKDKHSDTNETKK